MVSCCTVFPIIWQFSLDYIYVYTYFIQFLLYLVSILPLKTLNLAISPQDSFPVPIFSLSPFVLPFEPLPSISVLFPFSRKIYLPHPQSTILNLTLWFSGLYLDYNCFNNVPTYKQMYTLFLFLVLGT